MFVSVIDVLLALSDIMSMFSGRGNVLLAFPGSVFEGSQDAT